MLPLFLLLPVASAAELIVGASGDYATIADALAAAGYNDTISVQPGTYAETIWLATGQTIQAEQGLGTVIIDGSSATSNAVAVSNGAIHELVITGAPGQAVQLKGSNTSMKRCVVLAPGGNGVAVLDDSPTITEVAVYDAGAHAFVFYDGRPSVKRTLAVDPTGAGYAVETAGSYAGMIAIGGSPGFEVSADTSLAHIAALDSPATGLLAHSAHSVVNAIFATNPVVADCQKNVVDMGFSLLDNTVETTACPVSGFHDIVLSPPAFVRWSSGLRPPRIDLSLQAGSAGVDAGDGTDTDGSTADIGPFGGAAGDWTDGDGDGVPILFDCDDSDASANLHEREVKDGVDNDCDGEVDESPPADTGLDTGLDTGDPQIDESADIDGDGWTVAAGDCEDHNLATWPGADEIPDGADNDCDGVVDEGTWYVDDDGDGYTEAGGDCHDGDPARYPGAGEQGEDGVDDDCDGIADGTATADADGDGWTVGDGDCDDTRAGVRPDAFDGIDGIDGDCDGETDDDGLAFDGDGDGVTVGEMDCNDDDISISSTSPERADDGIDQDCDGVDLYDVDGDGHASPEAGGGDCDDGDATVYPRATEICDGLDNDCDGDVDEFCMDGSLDGPDQEPWEPGIHGRCNCSSDGGHRGAAGWLVLGAGLLALARRRRGARRA